MEQQADGLISSQCSGDDISDYELLRCEVSICDHNGHMCLCSVFSNQQLTRQMSECSLLPITN